MKQYIMYSFLAIVLFGFTSCDTIKTVNRLSAQPDSSSIYDISTPFLKAHMKDGQVYVFSEWKVMGRENLIQGNPSKNYRLF